MLTDIPGAEQKLSVQVWSFNGVHISHDNVANAHHGEILQQLTTNCTGADHEPLVAFECGLESGAETGDLGAVTILSHRGIGHLFGDKALLEAQVPPLFGRGELARNGFHSFLSGNSANYRRYRLKLSTASKGKFTGRADFDIGVESLYNFNEVISIILIVRLWKLTILVGKEVQWSKNSRLYQEIHALHSSSGELTWNMRDKWRVARTCRNRWAEIHRALQLIFWVDWNSSQLVSWPRSPNR